MKTTLRMVCALLLAGTAATADAQTWKITSLDWQPYSGSDLRDGGTSVQKLRDLLTSVGVTLKIEFYPWARAQKLAGTREYVGYFPAWPEEVYDGFVGSEPVDYSYVGAMSYMGSGVVWHNLERLFQNETIGYVRTYTYPASVEDLKKRYPRAMDPAPHESSLMRKLSRGRNSIALTDPAVMLYTAAQEGIHNIRIVHPDIERKALVLSFRQGDDNDIRMKQLNDRLKEHERERGKSK